MASVGAQINQPDRDFVMHTLLPLLLEAAKPYIANADTAAWQTAPQVTYLYGGAQRGFTSFEPWLEWLTTQAQAYQPNLTPNGYDSQWANLVGHGEAFGHWLQRLMHHLGLGYQPDRYSEALATIRRAVGDDSMRPVTAFLSALRGTDEMPAILEAIHKYADSRGTPDWRVAVPSSTDHFYRRRFVATAVNNDGRQTVYVLATGTSASRLVWRIYADEGGREYLGQLATTGIEGWWPDDNPEQYFISRYVVADELVGTKPTRPLPPKVVDIRDATQPCDAASYAVLLSSVRSFVGSKYADGHLEPGEAWTQAVVMPQRMTGIRVTRSDLNRALREEGWVQEGPNGWWYHRP